MTGVSRTADLSEMDQHRILERLRAARPPCGDRKAVKRAARRLGELLPLAVENRCAYAPRTRISAMSSETRSQYPVAASLVSPLAIVPRWCSKRQQSFRTLPPSTWCAAVAVPQTNPAGETEAKRSSLRRSAQVAGSGAGSRALLSGNPHTVR